MHSLTPVLLTKQHHTLCGCISVKLSHILKAGDIGDVSDTIAIAVAAGDKLSTTGNIKIPYRQSS